MFEEIVKIKPRLDPADAKRMEQSLSQRFRNISKNFGAALKAVVKGSIFGISLGLLNKLLNPLESLEEKIKTLLGQGTDIADLAERFGTSPGQLKRLEDVGKSLGLQPDQLKEMLTKFAEAVETARKEIQGSPFEERSATTKIVENFIGEKDLAEGFLKFAQGLKTVRQGPGKDVFFGEHQLQLERERAQSGAKLSDEERNDLFARKLGRHKSGQELADDAEKELFGAVQFGAGKRFLQGDFEAQAAKIKEPSAQDLTGKINKLADLNRQKSALEVQRETADLLSATSKLNVGIIEAIERGQQIADERENAQLETFEKLKQGGIAIERIEGVLQSLVGKVSIGIGHLDTLVTFLSKFNASSALRGYFFKKGGNE